MAITSVSSPLAITIGGVSTTTRSTGTITVNSGGTGYYYRSYYFVTGNATQVTYVDLGYRIGSWTYSQAPTDTALLTSLAGASALSYFVTVRQYTTSAYTTLVASLSSATVGITIAPRATGASLDAYNANSSTTITARWTEPSAHAGWRYRHYVFFTDSGGTFYPSAAPQFIGSGSAYSGTSGQFTVSAAKIAEIKNLTISLPGVKLYTRINTGWQLTGGAVYWGSSTSDFIAAYNTLTTWNVPAVPVSKTSDRYSKLKYWNGTSWLNPSQVKIWDGSIWNDLGTAGSYDTSIMKYWYNGTWENKGTLQGADTWTAGTLVQQLDRNPSLVTYDYFIYTYGTETVEVNRQAGVSWDAYACHLMSTANNYGWSGTTVGNDGTADIISLYWAVDGPRWIGSLRFRAANTSYYSAAPKRIDVKFLRADGTWTLANGTTTTDGNTWTTDGVHYNSYTIPAGSYTAALAWSNNYFQTTANTSSLGFVGMRIRVLNNTTYKDITQSTRSAGIELNCWPFTATNSWT